MNSTGTCPVENAGLLDSVVRTYLQNPHRILKPYGLAGKRVVDVGCGPGFFTLPMAEMTGPEGHVHALDLQEGMLDIVRKKIAGTPWEDRISLHQCGATTLGFSQEVDFVLAFYMVHEVRDKERFFREVKSILSSEGRMLMIEPMGHVSGSAFLSTMARAESAGLSARRVAAPLFSRAALLSVAKHEQSARE